MTNATPNIPLPANGQLLSITLRMFDPTLTTIAATVGNMIPITNLSQAVVKFGSGITKYDEDAATHMRRFQQLHGVTPTEGVLCWDMFARTRSNCPGETINTLNTAGVTISLNFGANTPGAGSYADAILEWLTLVR